MEPKLEAPIPEGPLIHAEIPSPRSNPSPSGLFPEEVPRESVGMLRPLSEKMADPRMVATMAMKEVHDVLEKYTKLARGLHSDDLPSMAEARSELLNIYRADFPELMPVACDEEFDDAASEAFVDSFRKAMQYLEDLKAGEVLALFTPWLRNIESPYRRRRRGRRAPPPSPRGSDLEDTGRFV